MTWSIFFVKQKTAYEMRISDWSSGVCSSDLRHAGAGAASRAAHQEGSGQLRRRNLFRRIALGRTQKVVVPSFTLMAIAAGKWSVPPANLLRIANGVDLRPYGGEAGNRSPLSGSEIDPPAVVIGTVAPHRPDKNVARLLHAFAALPDRN